MADGRGLLDVDERLSPFTAKLFVVSLLFDVVVLLVLDACNVRDKSLRSFVQLGVWDKLGEDVILSGLIRSVTDIIEYV